MAMTCDTDTNITAGRIERKSDRYGCTEYLLNETGTLRIAVLGDWCIDPTGHTPDHGYVNDGPADNDHVGPIAATLDEFNARTAALAADLIANP